MTNVFDGETLHVMKRQCATCIFRPGNFMRLKDGRVEQMERDALKEGGCIPCHKTVHGLREQEAICRGYFDRNMRSVPVIIIGVITGVVAFDG